MVQVLQTYLAKLQSYDPKIWISHWREEWSSPPLFLLANDIDPQPLDLKNTFHAISSKKSFTWYSGVSLIHTLSIQKLRRDMVLRWLKKEQNRLFERMLQMADTAEIGWLVYGTWQMEASVLAQAIKSTIKKFLRFFLEADH